MIMYRIYGGFCILVLFCCFSNCIVVVVLCWKVFVGGRSDYK